MCVALITGRQAGDPCVLPAVALGSSLLLVLERAVAVGALLAGTAVFLLRGWNGYFPSKVSTTGAEYAVPAVLSQLASSDSVAAVAIAEVEEREEAFRRNLDGLAARVEALESHKADML
jgi:hypothetical protein